MLACYRCCTVTGEIELDTSLFKHMPYSVGIAFSVPGSETPLEWVSARSGCKICLQALT